MTRPPDTWGTSLPPGEHNKAPRTAASVARSPPASFARLTVYSTVTDSR